MPPPPCNDQDPAVLALYDVARHCFDTAAPVPGVCLSDLHLTSAGGLGSVECAFAPSGAIYARPAVEGEWLTGEGFTFFNLEPYGPYPPGEYGSSAQDRTCDELQRCAVDCATGRTLNGATPPSGCGADGG